MKPVRAICVALLCLLLPLSAVAGFSAGHCQAHRLAASQAPTPTMHHAMHMDHAVHAQMGAHADQSAHGHHFHCTCPQACAGTVGIVAMTGAALTLHPQTETPTQRLPSNPRPAAWQRPFRPPAPSLT